MKRIILFIHTLALVMSLVSCNKYLNLEPENNTHDGVFWVDANNISKAVSGGYSMLRDAHRLDRSYFVFGDLVAGNFITGGDYWNFKAFSKSGGFNFNYAPYLENSLWNWTRYYQIINQCNLIIENTANIPSVNFTNGDIEKNNLIAQARFLRAYTNFYMQRVWGDILLIKNSFKDPQNIPPVARATQDEVLNFCIEDLVYAEVNIEENGSKAFGSVGAVKSLLAHIYAWKHDYINAERLANEVITSGKYSLEAIADYSNIWKGSSKETIFEIPMLYRENGNESFLDFFNIFLEDPYIRGKSASSTWKVDGVMLDEYFDEPEDRIDVVISLDNILLKYADVKYYDNNNADIYTVSNNLVLFRLADIYLLRAEAYYKNSKEGLALEDLNKIRERAGLNAISSSADDLFMEIFRERRRELIGEGSTQFDLIRMELFEKLDEFNTYYSIDRINNQGYYWPLNMRVLLPQDELLTQNPWWRNN
ncbi:RagB/SusD family nutrient uptake outer membrane protein [Sphingobacterium rhinopitheci]|uniref:RagB/SusD family nutrient uptake outer membrane protein n=1 Tax=Sphingobacterium rhinopitheci TaxID=2781960 RepID=UPI001F51B1D1|nr:RagB/SusD family nutrient uptake outer membrane protein [Sphingobacterium rhinopitheci]MCI0921723.1 RagB/SusD family nutrient uptake outer membrane protein [Sphingobacterium rhinopitheci]